MFPVDADVLESPESPGGGTSLKEVGHCGWGLQFMVGPCLVSTSYSTRVWGSEDCKLPAVICVFPTVTDWAIKLWSQVSPSFLKLLLWGLCLLIPCENRKGETEGWDTEECSRKQSAQHCSEGRKEDREEKEKEEREQQQEKDLYCRAWFLKDLLKYISTIKHFLIWTAILSIFQKVQVTKSDFFSLFVLDDHSVKT